MRWPWLVLALVGCSEPPKPSNEAPKPCKLDADCGPGRFCTEAGICRRDCYRDEHCIGPGTGAQCNAQGKCIEPVDAAQPPPIETGPDAPPEASDEAGEAEVGP